MNGDRQVKLVVFGPPLAGKRTLVQALARARHGQLRVFPSTVSGKPADLSELCLACTFQEADRNVEVTTFPGSVWCRDVWLPELARANGVAVAVSPEPQFAASAREHVRWFQQALETRPRRVAGVLSKADIDGVSMGGAALLSEVPVDRTFRTSVADAPSLLRPFEWLLAPALRVRDDGAE